MGMLARAVRKSITAPGRVDIHRLLTFLAGAYPDAECELAFREPFHLLVATILAAQSTDKTVNQIAPALFERYPNANALAAASPNEVEPLVFKTGFYRMKAKNIIGMARALVADHQGEVPREMAALVRLPGVARKTANVILSTCFDKADGVVVDTHVSRLAGRWGLSRASDAVKIEQDLMAALPQAEWIAFSNRAIWHGRRVCHARRPACNSCAFAPDCPSVELT